jgi:cytochrome o ubiquinol oxidase subunit IV
MTHEAEDIAPGEIVDHGQQLHEGLRSYAIGLALSALLTVAAFYLAQSDWIWAPSLPVALSVLAVAQVGVHLVFFLHLTSAPDSINNSLALAFGTLIVTLVIVGTLWIMAHMNANMAPTPGMQGMAATAPHLERARGVIEDRRSVPLRATSSGKIKSVDCDVGMSVVRGQICATFEAPTLEASVKDSERRLRLAKERLQTAQSELAMARAAVERAGPEGSPKAVNARKKLRSAGARAAQDVHKVEQLEHALDGVREKLAAAEIRAPFDGVILARSVEPGQSVAPHSETPPFVVASRADSVDVVFTVPAAPRGALEIGAKVDFTVEQLGGRQFQGVIRDIASPADGGDVKVVVSSPNLSEALRPGMDAQLLLPAR